MAETNFGSLNTEQLTTWSRDLWKAARNLSFMNQFAGKGENAMIQRITDLVDKDGRGARAWITLINDMVGDGVTGDYTLEGNEEELTGDDFLIEIDQLRNANISKGRLDQQKAVVGFREQSKDKLAYWLADRLDQVAILTLSGVPLTKTNKGANRPVLPTGRNLNDLAWASDITAPSTNRHLFINSGEVVSAGNGGASTAITANDKLSYKALVRAKAYANDHYVRGIRGKGNMELYHVFVTPQGMADLKLDPDFLANVRSAMPRSEKNPLFAGTSSIMQDGMVIHEFRHVYSNVNAGGGNMFGASGTIPGQRVLLCGAQAMGYADIGLPYWNEDKFDYNNKPGIAIGKMFGLRKAVLNSIYDGGTEDFGTIVIDCAVTV